MGNSCVDQAILTKLRGLIGEKVLRKLITLFLEDVPKKINSAIQSEKSGDLESVSSIAHSLISSTGSLGAVDMQKLSERIEALAEQRKAGEVSALLPELADAYQKAKVIFEEDRSLKGGA